MVHITAWFHWAFSFLCHLIQSNIVAHWRMISIPTWSEGWHDRSLPYQVPSIYFYGSKRQTRQLLYFIYIDFSMESLENSIFVYTLICVLAYWYIHHIYIIHCTKSFFLYQTSPLQLRFTGLSIYESSLWLHPLLAIGVSQEKSLWLV